MLIEEALMTFLLAETTITAYVGQRIYFMQAPKNTGEPYMVFSKISGPRVESQDGNSRYAKPRFQFSVFAEAYSDAKGCVSALQAVLQGYKGTMGGAGGVSVYNASYDDETDLYEEQGKLYQVAADYIIEHYE